MNKVESYEIDNLEPLLNAQKMQFITNNVVVLELSDIQDAHVDISSFVLLKRFGI